MRRHKPNVKPKTKFWRKRPVFTLASAAVIAGTLGGAWTVITWFVDRHDAQVRLVQTVDEH